MPHRMFKKVLIPTDGSPLSAQAANAGVLFAKSVGAEVFALHVTQPVAATMGFDGIAAAYALSDKAFEEMSRQMSKESLQAVLDRAHTAEVKATAIDVTSFNVSDGIVAAAKEHGCDLIFMGSHGRSGLTKLLLGSVTSKVLALSTIAVLVYRVKDID